jgi:hypothetical protein
MVEISKPLLLAIAEQAPRAWISDLELLERGDRPLPHTQVVGDRVLPLRASTEDDDEACRTHHEEQSDYPHGSRIDVRPMCCSVR